MGYNPFSDKKISQTPKEQQKQLNIQISRLGNRKKVH